MLYDVRRTLLSKTVLVSMALLIAISLLLISSFAVTTTTNENFTNTQALSWYDSSGGYHFLVFETNQFGQGVGGVNIQANLTMSQFAYYKGGGPITSPISLGSYPIYRSPTVATNSSGVAEFTISVPKDNMSMVNANYTAMISVNQPNGFPSTFGGGTLYYSQFVSSPNGTETSVPISPGQVVDINNNPISSVTDSKNSQIDDVQVIWAGPNGTVPKGYSLYYEFINQTCTTVEQGGGISTECSEQSPNQLNETNMNYLANLTTYEQIFPPPSLGSVNVSQVGLVDFALFYPNGTVTFQGGVSFGIDQFYPQAQTYTQGGIDQIVLQFFLSIFGLFIPLIAILGSYNSYGKDRVSGVLESVLALPVSRRGLSVSRFFSTFIAMVIAISISMVVVDGIVCYYAKSLVSASIMLSSSGAFFAELAAFIGIMMLLSRVIRSSGALIGIGIALFIVIDFFWSIIIALLANATNTNFGSLAYYGFVIGGEFVNPAQFVGLVDTYLTHQASMVGLGGIGGFGFPITPSQYGITIPSLVATGLLWAVIPLIGFLYLAIKKD